MFAHQRREQGIASAVARGDAAENLFGFGGFGGLMNRFAATDPAVELLRKLFGEMNVAGLRRAINVGKRGHNAHASMVGLEAMDDQVGERQLIGKQCRNGRRRLSDLEVPADFLPDAEQDLAGERHVVEIR